MAENETNVDKMKSGDFESGRELIESRLSKTILKLEEIDKNIYR